MNKTKLLIQLFLLLTFLFTNAYSQDTIKISKNMNGNYSDLIDSKTFCMNKTKEYEILRNKIIVKVDSLKNVIEILKEKHPSYLYHIEYKETPQSYFNWEGCPNNDYRVSHCDCCGCVDIDLKIIRGDKEHYNSDPTKGWTIYSDEIIRMPR